MKNTYALLLLLSLVVIGLVSCKKEEFSGRKTRNYSGEFIRNYFTLQSKITRQTPGFYPPQAARAYAYVSIAAYEAVYRGIPGAESLGGRLNGLSAASLPQVNAEEYNWALVANAAMAEVMRKMYEHELIAENLDAINIMEDHNHSAFAYGIALPVDERSVQYGKELGAAIYAYSTTDGGHQSYLNPFQLPYTLPAGDQYWVPTGPSQSPVSPYWEQNRPFMDINVYQTQPVAPVTFSTDLSSEFYQQANAVYNQVNANTQDQKNSAKFWADEPFNTSTIVGHTFNILTQLLAETGATLEKSAVAYARLGIAANDAFISCWKTKYNYVLLRPVSYIKAQIDPNFEPVIGTPAYPSYTSEHACQAGVGAKLFTSLFTTGDGNYNLTDTTQVQYGLPLRSFTNFDEMALECANSRFYGGVHYQMDTEKGLETGKKIGDNVNTGLAWPGDLQ